MSNFTQKRLKIWIAALVVIACGVLTIYQYLHAPVGTVVTQKDIQEGLLRAGRATSSAPVPVFVPIEIKRPVRIALGNLGFGQNGQNENVQDLVLAQLTGAPGLELVERQSLERVLGELNLSLAGLVRAKDALRAGKLVKADWFLLGTAVKVAGTNSLVLRIVDARTGILRDARVVSSERPAAEIASEIAGFVSASRQSAAKPQLRSFLAIGTFQDLSVNRRQAEFPRELRAYLMTAYRDSAVTLLEREAVDTLLQEVRLDLAGLADGSETNAPQPMQSAYWLVGGSYQSYETTNFQVEFNLEVGRAFGQYGRVFFRGKPDDSLFAEVKSAIDAQIKTNTTALWPTRNSEARMQLAAGKELGSLDLLSAYYYPGGDALEAAKRGYNFTEAFRAIQTALLLEPTNREVKLYFATCLRMQGYTHKEEARSLYREVIEEPIEDHWTGVAEVALDFSFDWEPIADRASWYHSASELTTNAKISKYYRAKADEAEKATVLKQGGSKAQEMAEAELLHNLTNVVVGKAYGDDLGIGQFVAAFGTNVAARRLVELYPIFKAKAPDAVPYFLPEIATAQLDTNEPVVAEFQQLLDTYAEHPDAIAKSVDYWDHIWREVCEWSFRHKLYRMAATTLEDEKRAIDLDIYHRKLSEEQKMALAFAYVGEESWSKALEMFESYSNRPVEIFAWRNWGYSSGMVLTSKEAANCRKKLGLPAVNDPREFEMGEDCLCMCTPSTFVADDSGLWIGIQGQLLHLSFELETNLDVRLPISTSTTVTSLSLTSSNIWIGTDGEGLIQYDRKTKSCRSFDVNDGLTTDSIGCAQILGDKLWIGYNRGVGFMDLSTCRPTSFTPSMSANAATSLKAGAPAPEGPSMKFIPRQVSAIGGRPGEVWFATESPWLRRYKVAQDTWDWPEGLRPVSTMTTDGDRLYVGQATDFSDGDKRNSLGFSILNLNDLKVQAFGQEEDLPGGVMTALASDGSNVWAGGKGYIALLDPKELKVRRLAYIPARFVNKIQIGGGYVWAQYNWHLHRAPLHDLE